MVSSICDAENPRNGELFGSSRTSLFRPLGKAFPATNPPFGPSHVRHTSRKPVCLSEPRTRHSGGLFGVLVSFNLSKIDHFLSDIHLPQDGQVWRHPLWQRRYEPFRRLFFIANHPLQRQKTLSTRRMEATNTCRTTSPLHTRTPPRLPNYKPSSHRPFRETVRVKFRRDMRSSNSPPQPLTLSLSRSRPRTGSWPPRRPGRARYVFSQMVRTRLRSRIGRQLPTR